MQSNLQTKNLLSLLSRNKSELDDIVLNFLPGSHNTEEIRELYEMMKDYPSRGGKGLRGTLCLLATELFGGSRKDSLITAASLELFQNWILIHDDIEDKSDLRRGKPALHKKYGVELSINAGDALHGKMWELLLRNANNLGKETTLKILSEFCTMLNETTEGQQMELSWNLKGSWQMSENDYYLMVTKKAAWYTCISPTRLGFIISRDGGRPNPPDSASDSEILDKLVEFGSNLGIAFQIIDDVLNLTADQSKYGKEILGDIYEGKRTLMVIHLLSYLDGKERENVIEILSKNRESKKRSEVELINQKMKESGSIDYAINIAKEYSDSALEEFYQIVGLYSKDRRDTQVYSTMLLLLKYLTTREY